MQIQILKSCVGMGDGGVTGGVTIGKTIFKFVLGGKIVVLKISSRSSAPEKFKFTKTFPAQMQK